MSFTIYWPPAYEAQMQNFFHKYEEMNYASNPDQKIKGIKPAKLRVCRFCGKAWGAVSFKKKAHILPSSLGNRYLISDFECDNCNETFGRYEDDLCKYLGLTRTIARIKNRGKTPGFLTKELKATKDTLFDDTSLIKVTGNDATSSLFEEVGNNSQSVEYTLPPYTPINVYKSILKMALCLIRENDLIDYEQAFEFLLSNKHDTSLQTYPLYTYILPKAYDDVFGMLFKKRSQAFNTTTHTFVLFFQSYMFQIFLPYNKQDYQFYTRMELPLFPPFFDCSGKETWTHLNQFSEDLSQTTKKTDGKSVFTMALQEDLTQMVAVDLKTRNLVNEAFDPSKVIGFYLLDDDFKLDLNN